MSRVARIIFVGSLLATCWLLMQALHEVGHIFGAWITGGVVSRVHLHPLEFSRTDMMMNPRPMVVAWAGPLVTCVGSIMTAVTVCRWDAAWSMLIMFFAGFCLISNGAYIGAGAVADAGDAADLVRLGAARWQLIIFGIAASTAGMMIWEGLGPRLGLTRFESKLSSLQKQWVPLAMAAVLIGISCAGIVLSRSHE